MNDEIRNENGDFEEEQLIDSPVKRALMVLFHRVWFLRVFL